MGSLVLTRLRTVPSGESALAASEKALKETRAQQEALGSVEPISGKDRNVTPPDTESGPTVDSPQDAADPKATSSLILKGLGPESGLETMKQMEELMEELINFQERFGPGAKLKERERRAAAS